MKKWLLLAVTLALMALIFWFSAQPGAVSGALSDQLAKTVETSGAQAVVPGWFSPNQNANIRKWAHIYIYCALGVSAALTVHAWAGRLRWRRQAALTAVLCTAYAASDELHQYFVPGRVMLASDVWVDAMGFLPCIALTFLLLWLWPRRRSGNKK